MPQESIFPMRPSYGGFLASDWKTPSAMVDRQMFPRQTKSTEIWSGIVSMVTKRRIEQKQAVALK